jgi:hypothetical protein
MPAARGNCLRGGVKFEIDGPVLRPPSNVVPPPPAFARPGAFRVSPGRQFSKL